MTPPALSKIAAAARVAFGFEGRLSRRAYWRLYLLLTAGTAAVWAAGLFAVLAVGRWGALVFLLFAPTALAFMSTSVRRAHDRNRGIIWWAIVSPGPLVLAALAEHSIGIETVTATWFAIGLSLLGMGLNIWGLIELGFRRGTTGANRFGAG